MTFEYQLAILLVAGFALIMTNSAATISPEEFNRRFFLQTHTAGLQTYRYIGDMELLDQQTLLNGLIGITKDMALERLAARGIAARVAIEDNNTVSLSEDTNKGRVNLVVRGGLVTAAYVG